MNPKYKDGYRFKYDESRGLYYPGATSIVKYRRRHLEPDFDDKMAQYAASSAAALDFGTRVDENVESLLGSGEFIPTEKDRDVMSASINLYGDITKIASKSGYSIVTQKIVISESMWCLGAIDILFESQDKNSHILDVKTTKKRKPKKHAEDYLMQLAIYSACYGEQYGRRVEDASLLYWIKTEQKTARTTYSREELIDAYREMVLWANRFKCEYFGVVNS